MTNIRSIVLILCSATLSSYLLHHSSFDQVILQISIPGLAILAVTAILFKDHVGNFGLSSVFGLYAGFLIATVISFALFAVLYLSTDSTYMDNYLSSKLVFSALVIAVFTGAFEEFVFRAPLVFVRIYRPVSTQLLSFFLAFSSLVFGLIHHDSHRSVIFVVSASAMGFLLGLLSIQLRSIWFAIGLHSGINFISFTVSGVHLGRHIDYPGVLSFDDAGNIIKTASSLVFPILGLSIFFIKNRSLTKRPLS